jgi:hypothetical protein
MAVARLPSARTAAGAPRQRCGLVLRRCGLLCGRTSAIHRINNERLRINGFIVAYLRCKYLIHAIILLKYFILRNNNLLTTLLDCVESTHLGATINPDARVQG